MGRMVQSIMTTSLTATVTSHVKVQAEDAAPIVNGSHEPTIPKSFKLTATANNARTAEEHDLVLKTIRLLVADLCHQYGGGHGG